MAAGKAPRGLWFRRVGWLVAIWAGSIAALTVVALLFRLLMNVAGMKS